MTSLSPEMVNGIIRELEPRLPKEYLEIVRDALSDSGFVSAIVARMRDTLGDMTISSPQSVIADFEKMVNDPSTIERDIQKFFKSNCWLLNSNYEKVESQKRAGEHHILDFRLRGHFDRFEIVELKGPNDGLFVTREGRLSKSVKLIKALEQLMEYRDYYLKHYDYVLSTEGKKVYKPFGILIMGRTIKGEEGRLNFENSYLKNIKIETYDEVVLRAKQTMRVYEKLGLTI